MKVSEIFCSIQGEGRYQGYPVLFIRTSGCNRSCAFCDTTYHIQGKNYTTKELIRIINTNNHKYTVWTGGEPLLQINEIREVIENTYGVHHLETNGDLINEDNLPLLKELFQYICISPKDIKTAKKIYKLAAEDPNIDIKVVTDLHKVGTSMLRYATTVMPLTTYDDKKDLEIRRKVWDYCVKHNLFYSARLHIEVWKKLRKK